MLARLASGEATVKELTEPFDMTPAAIAKHLKVLERPGLISSRQVAVYLEEYRGFWEAGFQCLDAYL
jgi:predicted transcriptional regulator